MRFGASIDERGDRVRPDRGTVAVQIDEDVRDDMLTTLDVMAATGLVGEKLDALHRTSGGVGGRVLGEDGGAALLAPLSADERDDLARLLPQILDHHKTH